MSKLIPEIKVTTTETVTGYTLHLSVEEAELLGTLRYYHIGGISELYSILSDLPYREEVFFAGMMRPDGRFIISKLRPRAAYEQLAEYLSSVPPSTVLSPPSKWRVPTTFKPYTPKPELFPKKWKVQYCLKDGRSWKDFLDWPGNYGVKGPFTSRNAAYRAMRERIKVMDPKGSWVEYRVVPQNTPEGREQDRGEYIVEVMYTPNDRRLQKYSRSLSVGRRFGSVQEADAAIGKYLAVPKDYPPNVAPLQRHHYRIKWVPTDDAAEFKL